MSLDLTRLERRGKITLAFVIFSLGARGASGTQTLCLEMTRQVFITVLQPLAKITLLNTL